MSTKAPNIKPLDGKAGGEAISDKALHSEDKRNLPDGKKRLGGNSHGFKAGKPPGGKR